MERVTWKHITICKVDSQQEFALCLRKVNQELCINLEGWDGEGDEREVQKGRNISMPGGSEVKASVCNAGDPGLILGLGRSPGEGNGNPLQ